MQGVVRFNVNHMVAPFTQKEALYRTGISVGDYPVDHHHAPEKKAPGIEFPSIPSFNVPLGALLPQKVEGLIVCEKGISVSNIANGATRLQPVVMLTGQAAGILAALSLQQKKPARQVAVRDVQQVLLQEKAYIMPYVDVQPNDPAWEAIQRIGATGFLQGRLVPQGWANKTYFDPDSTVSWQELRAKLKACYSECERLNERGDLLVTDNELRSIAGLFKNVMTAQNLAYTLRAGIQTKKEVAVFLDRILPVKQVDLMGRWVR